MIAVIILMLAALAVNGQTPITTANCPTGEYVNYKSTAYAYGYSPVRQLTSGSYSYCGFYGTTASTAAASADQCCKACATQSGGACTTWTYDGCGRCYLSSATGTGVYLYYSSPASVSTMCGSTQTCSSFVSGFISSAASSNGQVTTASPGATTTAAATTTTSGAFTTTTAGGAFTTTTVAAAAYSCFFNNNVNVATPPNSPNADTQVTASSSQDCCNKCGNTNGCLGFAFLSTSSTSGACWLKYYNPFGSNTPSQQTAYPGMVLGSLQGLAGK